MSRLIDGDKLIEEIKRTRFANSTQVFTEEVIDFFVRLVDNAPTEKVDSYAMGYQDGVRKVLSEGKKPGTWKRVEDDVSYWYECSICGERPLHYYESECLSDYCPNCGAKMTRGEEE